MKKTVLLKISGLLALTAFLAAPALAGDMVESIIANISSAEKKMVSLAEAIPAEKYDWRPAEGVRSVSETLMHVASTNYFFGARFGKQPPEGIRGLEKSVTAKADVVAKLKESFAFLKGSLEGTDLSKPVKLFGGKEGTLGDMALMAVSHAHEHLGQLIAYARFNKITPPWSK